MDRLYRSTLCVCRSLYRHHTNAVKMASLVKWKVMVHKALQLRRTQYEQDKDRKPQAWLHVSAGVAQHLQAYHHRAMPSITIVVASLISSR